MLVDVYTSDGRTVPAEVRPLGSYPGSSSSHALSRYNSQNVSISFQIKMACNLMIYAKKIINFIVEFVRDVRPQGVVSRVCMFCVSQYRRFYPWHNNLLRRHCFARCAIFGSTAHATS